MSTLTRTRDQDEVSSHRLHVPRRVLRGKVLPLYGFTRLLGIRFTLPRYLRDGTRERDCSSAVNVRAWEEEVFARGEDAFREDGATPGESRTGPLPRRGENRGPLRNVTSLFSLRHTSGNRVRSPSSRRRWRFAAAFDDDDVARNLRGYARIPRRELLPVYNLHVFTVTRRVGVGENAARESGRRYTYIVSKHLSRNIMHNNVGGGLLLCRLLTRGRASMVKRFSASVV